ncbi:assembly of actin patch protein [Marasmius sp. AFHP31]|nr:assembly of actin patch protein [Marasmius sp. AFHP31]
MSTFHSAKDMNFTGGNFSIVHGNQSNHYYVHSARSLERNHRVQPGEEWKEMMYQEYERIPLGRIKLLKTLLGTVDTRERYTTATTRESLPEAERGRIGVEVREVATGLYKKSKRALIGDGTYRGFVDATLAQVLPNVATPDSYGYLIYQQTGSSVQKRMSKILLGDIMWLKDAKMKGHKGHTQHVGKGDDACGAL